MPDVSIYNFSSIDRVLYTTLLQRETFPLKVTKLSNSLTLIVALKPVRGQELKSMSPYLPSPH